MLKLSQKETTLPLHLSHRDNVVICML